jgi:hypothetical protein
MPPSPAAAGDDMLDRLVRQVHLLPGIVARLSDADVK